jgi:hypothetical protein
MAGIKKMKDLLGVGSAAADQQPGAGPAAPAPARASSPRPGGAAASGPPARAGAEHRAGESLILSFPAAADRQTTAIGLGTEQGVHTPADPDVVMSATQRSRVEAWVQTHAAPRASASLNSPEVQAQSVALRKSRDDIEKDAATSQKYVTDVSEALDKFVNRQVIDGKRAEELMRPVNQALNGLQAVIDSVDIEIAAAEKDWEKHSESAKNSVQVATQTINQLLKLTTSAKEQAQTDLKKHKAQVVTKDQLLLAMKETSVYMQKLVTDLNKNLDNLSEKKPGLKQEVGTLKIQLGEEYSKMQKKLEIVLERVIDPEANSSVSKRIGAAKKRLPVLKKEFDEVISSVQVQAKKMVFDMKKAKLNEAVESTLSGLNNEMGALGDKLDRSVHRGGISQEKSSELLLQIEGELNKVLEAKARVENPIESTGNASVDFEALKLGMDHVRRLADEARAEIALVSAEVDRATPTEKRVTFAPGS